MNKSNQKERPTTSLIRSESFKAKLSELIISYRKPEGKPIMSQRELSILMKMSSHSTIGLLERAQYKDSPYPETLQKVADFFKIPLTDLLAYLNSETSLFLEPDDKRVGQIILEIQGLRNPEHVFKILHTASKKFAQFESLDPQFFNSSLLDSQNQNNLSNKN